MTPIANLLAHFEKVTQTRNPKFDASYKACCPAHDDTNPSLGIALTDDGKILINCLSHQCAPADILAAVGLSFSDLYPKPLHHHSKGIKKPFPAAEVLRAISLEVTVVCICAESLMRDKDINTGDFERLQLAYSRINAAIDAGAFR